MDDAENRIGSLALNRGVLTPQAGLPAGHSPALGGASAVVRLVERLARSQGRDDLATELQLIEHKLQVRPVEVLLVGAPGQGKSSVVNALVGAPICPTGPDGVTVADTCVGWGPAYSASVWREPTSPGRAPEQPMDYADAVALSTSAANPSNNWGLRAIAIKAPASVLERGLTLIDTPGVRSVWSPQTSRLMTAMGRSAAVVLVTSAASTLTAGELDLLRIAASACPRVVVVVNGTSTFDSWRAIVEHDELLLERRGVPAEVIALDASPYWTDAGGLAPGPDSGMARLGRYLAETVVLEREQTRISAALTESFWSADRLRMRLWAERELIGDDAAIDAATGQLEAASVDALALCSDDASWRTRLQSAENQLRRDMASDVNAERQRLAALSDEASNQDAEAARTEFHRQLCDAVAHLQRLRKLSLRALARTVADAFGAEARRIGATLPLAPDSHALGLPRLDRPAAHETISPETIPLRTAVPRGSAVAASAGAGAGELTEWLDVAMDLMARENEDAIGRTISTMRDRCNNRAIELHRSLVEVRTAVQLLRGADAQLVMARQQTLTDELEQLATVDWRVESS